MEGGQFGRTGLFFSCEKGERVDDERLAKIEDLEIFRSLDGHLFKYCCTIHCTTNFKLPVNSRNCQNFPTILCQLGGKL